MKVAFLGLGNMGAPMAVNLLAAGYSLTVFDTDKTKVALLVNRGASAASNAADTVATADVVFTSLPNPKVIESVALGETGILKAMRKGSTWIDMSTNNLQVERAAREIADKASINMLDAPVTGGIEGAAEGTLTIMVGGNQEVFANHKALIDVLGSNVIYLGGHGSGYVAKISQVSLCYLNSVALSEALMLGVKGGVPAETMLEIIQMSTGTSYVADRYGPELLNGSYDAGFTLGLAHKDMQLMIELAATVDAQLPMSTQVEAIYARAVDTYGYEQNHLMALKLLEDDNDTLIRAEQF